MTSLCNKGSYFLISLDFEMYWGVRDHFSIIDYQENLLGVRDAITGMLELFEKKSIHATWAVVGMLFFEEILSLKRARPNIVPTYVDKNLSPYKFLSEIDESIYQFLFAPEMIRKISNTRGQEIATHTFSHYYACAAGQTLEQFTADMEAAITIAAKYGIELTSIIFPRNECNKNYFSVLKQKGFNAYRGRDNCDELLQEFTSTPILFRALRLIDSYFNLSGNNLITPMRDKSGLLDLKGSRFFRPYVCNNFLESRKLRRIKNSMEVAARSGKSYHLWWHPHNFGKNTQENLDQLAEILDWFSILSSKYEMKSVSMNELSFITW